MTALRVAALLLLLCFIEQSLAIQVIDDRGNRVYLEKPAQRIVSLAPHITEMLFAAGAGDQVVAAVSHSDYPEAAKALPRVGTYTNINLELLVAHQPDLVVAWESGNGPPLIGRLQELGLPLYITNPEVPEDIAINLTKLGVLTGNEKLAQGRSEKFSQELTRLQSRYSGLPPVSVFYQVWSNPLVTINGKHLISHLIEICGGSNVYSSLPSLAPQIGIEAVVAADPEVIIASGMGESRPDWLDAWKQWPELRAVKRNHLFYIPPDIVQRHSLRVLEGARLLCEQLELVRQQRLTGTDGRTN